MLVFLLCISSWTQALVLCATNSTALRSALAIAEDNNEHDVIKIAQGIYATSGTSFYYQEEQGWDLEISGGWSFFSNNSCGKRIDDPSGTILDGETTSRALVIRLFGNSSLKLSNMSFINGHVVSARGGGLQVNKVDNLALGVITVENTIFINNEAEFNGAMTLSGANEIIVRNNLFSANHASQQNSVFVGSSNGIYFTNNTVISNTAGITDEAGVYIVNGESSQLLVANNVLQDNGALDLEVIGIGPFYFKHNNIGNKFGFAIEDVGNFSLPSRFESNLNFRPSSISPLVNAGIEPCTGFCQFPRPFDETWSIGEFDLTGGARVESTKVDIGAGESIHDPDLIFWNIFE